jgi:hypothetical protein
LRTELALAADETTLVLNIVVGVMDGHVLSKGMSFQGQLGDAAGKRTFH